MAKDLVYASKAFAGIGIALPSAAAAKARFDQAIEDGQSRNHMAAIVESLRKDVSATFMPADPSG